MEKRRTFVGIEPKEEFYIDEIVYCELKSEPYKGYHGDNCFNEVYYAILKNGKKVKFNYFYYKKYLETHQKIK